MKDGFRARIGVGLAALLLAAFVPVPGRASSTGQVVLIAQGEELDVYDIDSGAMRPSPLVKKTDWVNGPACFVPGDPNGRFIEANDNPDITPSGEEHPFWGLFEKDGTWTGARYGQDLPLEDPAGCAFDSAGNLFGMDVGADHTPFQGDGKLIEFFAPNYATSCILATGLSQPGISSFDSDGSLLVPQSGAATITRYSNFPANASQCSTHPPTSAEFLNGFANGIGTPIGIVRAPGGGWAVSSVLVPAGIFHVSASGSVDGVLAAPGPDTGTPFGLGFDSAGNLYYADLGVRPFPLDGTDPTNPIDAANGQAALKMVPAGGPPVPKTIIGGMDFADGLVVVAASSIAAAQSSCSWTSYGHDLGHSFAADPLCSKINSSNVSTLHLKWFFHSDVPVTVSPSVDNGLVYIGDAGGTFYAFPTDPEDPLNVTPVWTFHVRDKNKADYGKIVSSPAVDTVGGRRIVAFGGASSLYVLDAATGAELASSCFDPRPDPPLGRCNGSEQTIEIESSPVILHTNGITEIVVGMDFNEDPNVGRAGVVGLRLNANPWSLTPMWKYDPERQVSYGTDPANTGPGYEYTPDPLTAPPGGAHKGSGCGNVWSSTAVDVAAGLVFFGTGNCSRPTMPPGEFGAEAIHAVSLATGKLVWRYAPRETNGRDLDFGASPNLLGGGLVGEGGKDGIYYALNRATGALKWTAGVAMPSDIGGMIGSTAIGEVNGKQAIFATSAIPQSTREAPDFDAYGSDPGRVFALHAIDAATGAILWHATNPLPSYGAAVYANGVVFLSDTFGFQVHAYDANTGLLLWVSPLDGAPSSAPAVVGDSIYMGAGTSAPPFPDNPLNGIWAFTLA